MSSITVAPFEIDPVLADAQRRSTRLERDAGAHRVLTGDRPTGPLHVGHYFGTLLNRVRLQDLGAELLVLIADYQTITDRDSPDSLPGDVEELVADYLAVGIDPARASIFTHSQIAALNQLVLPFLSLVSVPELARNPTVKEERLASGLPTTSGLMLTCPVHQAADILFCHADVVPVGKDQLPHVELTRSIARRFNRRYSPDRPFFGEPAALLSEAPVILGTDGQKMSKSRRNAIALGATEDETARLIRGARTDSDPRIAYDPVGRPEISNLILLTALAEGLAPEQVTEETAGGGAAALKRRATDALNARLRPVRARRAELVTDRGFLRRVLHAGNERANALAQETLDEVQRLMHTVYRTSRPWASNCDSARRVTPPRHSTICPGDQPSQSNVQPPSSC
jgi:tryptophanyl-tRNA synthetase